MTISIAATDMGAFVYGSSRVDKLVQTRRDDHELPSKVIVSFANKDIDYQQGTEYASRLVSKGNNTVNIQLPISMDQDQGADIADVLLSTNWTERVIYNLTLPFKYARIEPTDILSVTVNSATHTIFVTKVDYYPPSLIKIEGVANDSADYSPNTTAGSVTTTAQTVGIAGLTRYELMDIPILRDADDSAGFYIAGAGYYTAWLSAVLYRSVDSGETYTEVDTLTTAATIGSTTDALADASPWQWDYTNTVNIRLVNGSFSTDTEINVLNDANAVLIGSEIILFLTATLEADGTYTLSNLIRGRKGTEWATSSHAIGDRVVLLNTTTLIRVSHDNSAISSARKYKMVTTGNYLQTTTSEDFTSAGVALEPYAPTNIEGSRSAGDLTITWTRRSRLSSQTLRDPVLGEDSESYEVDIISTASPQTVLRTLTSSSETVTYTAAQQATDWGSPQPGSVEVNVYQLSATVGRGYAGNATI